MIVNFTLYKEEKSWSSRIHQLNDDVLLRHVHLQGKVAQRDIDFSYCERSHSGNILDSENQVIGHFNVFSS